MRRANLMWPFLCMLAQAFACGGSNRASGHLHCDPGSDCCRLGTASYQPMTTDSPPSEVTDAAQSGLTTFGVVGGVGTPYPVLKLDSPGRPTQTIVDASHQWYFPVTIGGSYAYLLTVAMVKGQWQAVSIGENELALWLQSAETSFSQTVVDRAIVQVYGFGTAPMDILGFNLSEGRPVFEALPIFGFSSDMSFQDLYLELRSMLGCET